MRTHLDARQVRLVNEVARTGESRVVTTARGDAIISPASAVPPASAAGHGAAPGVRRHANDRSTLLPATDVQIDTHWTRILHVDLFGGHDDAAADEPRSANARRRPAGSTREPADPARAPGPHFRSPLASALALLGLYVVMSLTFAGFVELLGMRGPSAADTAPPTTAANASPTAR